MKHFLTVLLFLLLLCTISCKASQSHPTREELRQTLLHAQQLIKQEADKEVAAAQAETKAAQADDEASKAKLVASQSDVSTLKVGLKNLTDWGNAQQAEKLAALSKLADANKKIASQQAELDKYHHEKFWICAALSIFAGLWLERLIPTFAKTLSPLYSAGIAIAFAATVFGFTWRLI